MGTCRSTFMAYTTLPGEFSTIGGDSLVDNFYKALFLPAIPLLISV